MNALESLGYMELETNIIQIRNVELGIVIEYDDLLLRRKGLELTSDAVMSDGWELGWHCAKCDGSGQIQVPCPRCADRTCSALLENPCCGGSDDADCPDCTEGIQWEKEY